MADQEFLASFGVDIDETGVSRLQQILTENQTLAKSLSDRTVSPLPPKASGCSGSRSRRTCRRCFPEPATAM